MIISQSGIVDIIPEYNRALRPIFCVSEGDADSRMINLTVKNAGELFTIPEGANVYVAGKKLDNTIFTYECSYSGYIVTFPITEQMSAVSGLVLCEIQIVVAGDPLGSANFCFWVEPSPIENGTTSESDLNIFVQAISDLGGYEFLTDEVAVLSARMDQFARLPDGSLSTAADAELADIRVKADGQTASTAGDAVRAQVTELKSQLTYKADNVYGGATSNSAITLISGKAWNATTGRLSDANTRASANPIEVKANMRSVSVKTGYLFYVFGNNQGAGYSLSTVLGFRTTKFMLDDFTDYRYLFFMVRRNDDGDITGDNLSDVLILEKFDNPLEYATQNSLDNTDAEIAQIETLNSEVLKENLHGYYNGNTIVGGSVEGFVFRVLKDVHYTFSCDVSFDRKVIAYSQTKKPSEGVTLTGKTELTSNNFTSPYTGWAFLYVNTTLNTDIENTFTIKSYAPIFLANTEPINVCMYGAKGDGSDCTAAVASAISACPVGGEVYFPVGTYVVTNIALKSNMSIVGDGKGSIIQLAVNVAEGNNCCTINNVHDVSVLNIAFDGNRLNNKSLGDSHDTGFNGLHIRNSYNIIIDNVWSYNNGYHGCIMTRSHDIIVKNSKFYNNGYRPVHGHDTVNSIVVEANECWNNGLGFDEGSGMEESGYDGIFFFDGVEDLMISNNNIHDVNTLAGIQIGGNVLGDGNASKNIIISNNIVNANGVPSGISILGRGIENLIIEGNTIYDCEVGIYFYDASTTADNANKNITVSGNTIQTVDYGIKFINRYSFMSIVGNSLSDGEQFGISFGGDQHDIIINANIITDFLRGIVVNTSQDINISNNTIKATIDNSPMLASINVFNTCNRVYVLYNFCSHQANNASTNGITLPS